MEESSSDISNYSQLVSWVNTTTKERKERLLTWIQSKLPELQITNLTTDWNDGRALGALVDAVARSLCPDWRDWDPKDCIENASEAMQLANYWLDIPQFIKPEEIVNPNVDEQAMINYLSFFPNAKLVAGAPLRPRTRLPELEEIDASSDTEDEAHKVDYEAPSSSGSSVWYEDEQVTKTLNYVKKYKRAPPKADVSKFKVSDLDSSAFVCSTCSFFIDSIGKEEVGAVTCTITNPSGVQIPAMTMLLMDGTYMVRYVPFEEGTYIINIFCYNKPLPGFPFEVDVRSGYARPHNIRMSGPCVCKGTVPASIQTAFKIDVLEAGNANLKVKVVGPGGERKTKIVGNGDGTFTVTFLPDDAGQYRVDVKYAEEDVPQSPFGFKAFAIGSADKCRITYGIRENVRIGEGSCIIVNKENAGNGEVTCTIRSTSGSEVDTRIVDNGDDTVYILYKVKDAGKYTVSIKFGGRPISGGFYTFTCK